MVTPQKKTFCFYLLTSKNRLGVCPEKRNTHRRENHKTRDKNKTCHLSLCNLKTTTSLNPTNTSNTNTTKKDYKWFKTGFSPRKQSMTLYIMDGFESYDEILSRLGKHKLGKSCLYINKLADVNLIVLRELIKASVKHMDS